MSRYPLLGKKRHQNPDLTSLFRRPMSRKPTTFRLDPEIQAGLTLLSELRGMSQNQLVNEAVRELIARRAREVVIDLESTLAV